MTARRRVKVVCPECGSERWISAARAKKNTHCKKCHNKAIARKGYEATLNKHGLKFAVRFLRDYLLEHPSSLEVQVAAMLDGLGVSYEREYHFEPGTVRTAGKSYLVDFAIYCRGTLRFIEVNGFYVHQFHTERDSLKIQSIDEAGIPVLVLNEADVKSPDLNQIIARFLT